MSNKTIQKICLCILSGFVLVILPTVRADAGTLPTGSYYPDSCDLSHCEHPEASHFYATGRTYWQDTDFAEGVAYLNGVITTLYYGDGVPSFPPGMFTPDFQEGWYYFDFSAGVSICRCDGNHNPESACEDAFGKVVVDHDTFKSEAPSGTVIVSDTLGAKQFLDLKVHALDAQDDANQKLLVQYLAGANSKVLVAGSIYPRRDLSTAENGSLKILTWNNLPKNRAGAVKAVVYNQTDKAYVINGTIDANGTAVFSGFKLRPASTITICK